MNVASCFGVPNLTPDTKALTEEALSALVTWIRPRNPSVFGGCCLAEGPRRKPGEKFGIAVKYNLKRKSMIARIRAMNHHNSGERLKSFDPLQRITRSDSHNGKDHTL